MLKQLDITNFTAFADASFTFSPGLNVVVGANGTGKTHLLKLGYLFTRAWPDFANKRLPLLERRAEGYFEDRLMGLFRPERLENLLRQGTTGQTAITAEVTSREKAIAIDDAVERSLPWSPDTQRDLCWQLAFKQEDREEVALRATRLPQGDPLLTAQPLPLFIPSKEFVSLFDGLIALFETYKIPLDETYRDLAVAMTVPESMTPSDLLSQMIEYLSQIVGGELMLEKGKLRLRQTDGKLSDVSLMAEGYRKLGLLLYLVRRNVIQPHSTLFWDEPEANLNPELMRPMVEGIVGLAANGVQVILATHSLFVLREIEILMGDQRFKGLPTRFIALAPGDQGVQVSSGDRPEDVDPIAALDADLEQSDRYMELE
ncbi:ATP-binding protein [uncultured Thiodictyon sp.]|uniref:AAA family ATPase n=1 Tax=uncultured Thiodictyon sp. TaxID=1846217 RepID=UPI0025F7498A|nr:ATP-binding protein [uncultured Thiodictyon sp.]